VENLACTDGLTLYYFIIILEINYRMHFGI